MSPSHTPEASVGSAQASHQAVDPRTFRPARAWEALHLATLNGITVRLHWTDMPYHWHVNDGQEVFAVLDGQVEMHVRAEGSETVISLMTGDVFVARLGCEHMAVPQGEARILVVETEGSE